MRELGTKSFLITTRLKKRKLDKVFQKLKEQSENMGNETTLHVNNVRHQFKNSECGIYSINFILRLLEGNTFEDLKTNIVKDDEMEENREKLFVKYF